MYKIHPGGDGKGHRPVYLAAEGATPMLTFYEIIKHSHKQTGKFLKKCYRKIFIGSN